MFRQTYTELVRRIGPLNPKTKPQALYSPQGSKYPIIIYSPNPKLHNYHPKTEYLIIGSFGPLGL